MQYAGDLNHMKLSVIIIIVSILLIYGLYYRKNPLTSKVRIGSNIFVVEVSVSPIEKMKGLSGRDSLAANHGMLFVYDHKEQYEFWMKGMKFPLDFIFIADRTVVDISENILPPSSIFPAIVKPQSAADKILEVPAGTIQSTGIKIGDTVQFIDR